MKTCPILRVAVSTFLESTRGVWAGEGDLMSDAVEKLRGCFVQAFGIAPEAVTDDLTYNSIKEWDSVGHMALMSEIETVFDLMLDTDDILNLSSFSKAKEILTKYSVGN